MDHLEFFVITHEHHTFCNPISEAKADRMIEVPQLAPGAEPGSFDLAACIGATWIWGGLRGTLLALATAATPEGLVLVGEPFWLREPSPGYLRAMGIEATSFAASHRANVEVGLDLGLGLLHAVVADADDWDRYEGLQWAAAERFARDHPEREGAAELVARVRAHRDAYLRWGRDELGWALYLFARGVAGDPGQAR